jgi:hypothetical protein
MKERLKDLRASNFRRHDPPTHPRAQHSSIDWMGGLVVWLVNNYNEGGERERDAAGALRDAKLWRGAF